MDSSLRLSWTSVHICDQKAVEGLTQVWQLAVGWFLGSPSGKLAQAPSPGALRTSAMREIKPACCSGFYLHHICCSPIGQCRSHSQGLVSAEGLRGNKDRPDRTQKSATERVFRTSTSQNRIFPDESSTKGVTSPF